MRIEVEKVKTVALRSWDCRMFASEVLWNDAAYALSEGTQPALWHEVGLSDTAAREQLRARFGDLPTHPGEYVEYPGADTERATIAAEMAQGVYRCLCPDDCNCRSPHRANYCGCRRH